MGRWARLRLNQLYVHSVRHKIQFIILSCYLQSSIFVCDFMNWTKHSLTCRICRNISDCFIIWFIKKTLDVYYVLWDDVI